MNILYQGMEQVFVKYTWGLSFAAILGTLSVVAAIFFIWAFVSCIIDSDSDAVICLVTSLCFIGLALVCFHLKPTYKDVMTYQVTLDDTYSYNQLVEQYDVIETKGQILTIREKGWDDDIPKEGD